MPSNSILTCNNTLFQSTRASPYTYEPNSPPTIATLQGIRSTPTSSTLIKNNSLNYGHNHTHTGIGGGGNGNGIGNGGPIQSSINFLTTLNGHSSTGTLMNGTIPNGSAFRNSKNRFISKSNPNHHHQQHPHQQHHNTTTSGTLLSSIVATNNINSQPIATASSSTTVYHIPPPSSATIAGHNHVNSIYTTSINQPNNSSSLISATKQQQPLLDLSRVTNPSASLAALAHRTGSGTSSSGFAPLAQTSTPSRSTGDGSGGVGGGGSGSGSGSGGGGGGGGGGPTCGYGLNVSTGLHRVPRSGSNSDCDVISSSTGHFFRLGVHGMLASLALMCLLSLMMAFLALFFLQKTGPIITIPDDLKSTNDLESFLPSSSSSSGPLLSPLSSSSSPLNSKSKDISSSPVSSSSSSTSSSNHKHHHHSISVLSQSRIVVNSREYMRVFQVSVGLSTLTIALNLVCLFVCCIQFLAAVKFLKTPQGYKRTHQFLKNNSTFRVIAIGCFLMSIPIFFTGIILFTFINFDEVPALVTSGFIGIGIVFCGFASVHTVYQWQCEKTKASQEASKSRLSHLDSGLLQPVELSTLV
ncbi:uncharacterized protein LOC141849211 [Brevipalpus obovatus]|uniref:uncharacterized protein LOC141849211 n=1 Tax=Brevipalpus obovatus TaxID=246614 RepID=UPI003D9DC877